MSSFATPARTPRALPPPPVVRHPAAVAGPVVERARGRNLLAAFDAATPRPAPPQVHVQLEYTVDGEPVQYTSCMMAVVNEAPTLEPFDMSALHHDLLIHHDTAQEQSDKATGRERIEAGFLSCDGALHVSYAPGCLQLMSCHCRAAQIRAFAFPGHCRGSGEN